MTAGAPSWEAWAPPLDPPTAEGLPAEQAQVIADQWWATEPHECAARQREHCAATLPQTPVLAAVTTGAQSVAYSPAQPGGEFGLAVARAAWHRSLLPTLASVPLRVPARRR